MIYFLAATLVLAADIITKLIAENNLIKIGTIPVIEDIFHLTYVQNRGMAFGMLGGGRIFFIISTIAIIALLAFVYLRTEKKCRSIWLKAGMALVLSGAIGNLIERIFKGYVVDFLDFRIINFPVFNIADIAVCVGAAMLVIHFLKSEDKANE